MDRKETKMLEILFNIVYLYTKHNNLNITTIFLHFNIQINEHNYASSVCLQLVPVKTLVTNLETDNFYKDKDCAASTTPTFILQVGFSLLNMLCYFEENINNSSYLLVCLLFPIFTIPQSLNYGKMIQHDYELVKCGSKPSQTAIFSRK